MRIFGVSFTSLIVLFIVFWLGTRYPNALNFRRG